VEAFINNGNLGVNIDLGTWHMARLPLASERCMVNIHAEHADEDIQGRAFEEMFNILIEVVL
jgi:ureidoglycolate hydrolase